MIGKISKAFILFIGLTTQLFGQSSNDLWHGKKRSMHYYPRGTDLIKRQGTHRFNRALYGTNTGFRVEAGDLPEFALYMPGMGGNLKLGISRSGKNKWFTDIDSIEAIYRPGSMLYTLRDHLWENGQILLNVLSTGSGEGIIIKIVFIDMPEDCELVSLFGGASGKKFNRDGDIGADPESVFYLNPENCLDNEFTIDSNTFSLSFGLDKSGKLSRQLKGVFPENASLYIVDANDAISDKIDIGNSGTNSPVLVSRVTIGNNQPNYLLIENPLANGNNVGKSSAEIYRWAEEKRAEVANRISVNTPDSFINTLGPALSIAADAVWEYPTYLHGAIAWRMRLNAWRGAYVADPLGWHDRARAHFDSYALSQVKTPLSGPVVFDTTLNHARQLEEMGTSMFSAGYICRNPNGDIRPHHYDMNLVFIDQLLNHFKYTGDKDYVKKMWPVLKLHLDWEKRNFDADDDGLYDAYACIWASDALQYSGGGVTHSSAYNYRANVAAAQLAKIIGESPTPFKQEAVKIKAAVNKKLWLKGTGSYAEYIDADGLNVHPAAGLWTIYHAADANLPDMFQSYQALRYVDQEIPHIPVKADGLVDTSMYLLSTTNWQPYTWSVNNVALAENLHAALAYWQGGQSEAAAKLWCASLVESMFLGTSPGNFQQLSFYDAVRGELYRDFADPIGMAARTLTEGLFGIIPDALHDSLSIAPGFPSDWKHASLTTPDIDFAYKALGNKAQFEITQRYEKLLHAQFKIPVTAAAIDYVKVNGKKVKVETIVAVGKPFIQISLPKARKYSVEIAWQEGKLEHISYSSTMYSNQPLALEGKVATIIDFEDPQGIFKSAKLREGKLTAQYNSFSSYNTAFIKLRQGEFTWWQPLDFHAEDNSRNKQEEIVVRKATPLNIRKYYNDKVTNIFGHKYAEPRSENTTLQLPWQGIGNWCYPKIKPVIDDNGLRKASRNGKFKLPSGIEFDLPEDSQTNNISFVSQWNNFPDSITVQLPKNRAGYISLLMTGTTNHMQSQLENGKITITYSDGSTTEFSLRNPETWWPIEQDYMDDSYAFKLKQNPPTRIHLKTGKIVNGLLSKEEYTTIKGFTENGIDGGAATVINVKTDAKKMLKSLTVKATASEVVIGLMGISILN